MRLLSGSRTRYRRLEAAASYLAIGYMTFGILIVMTMPLVSALAIGFSGPPSSRAALVRLTSTWEVSWQDLGQDDWGPTPSEGYCDASLTRRRLHLGPLEIRYSYSY